MHVLPLFTRGNVCPRCGRHTDRVRTPLVLRPLRLAFATVQRRTCRVCGWHGFAFPQRTPQAQPPHQPQEQEPMVSPRA
jgi:hypothetical protein